MAHPRRGKSGAPSRRVSKQAQSKAVHIFVEGERTEEDYLIYWARKHRDAVVVTFDAQRGVPRTLIDAAVEFKKADERASRRGAGRAYDEIWCVFDVDEHPALDEVRVKARSHGIHLAVSNPCLELWFILHFQDQSAHIHRHDAQRISEAHLGCGKTLSSNALDSLDHGLPEALERATKLDEKHAGDGSPPGHNPSSGVGALVESIRNEAA